MQVYPRQLVAWAVTQDRDTLGIWEFLYLEGFV